MAAMRNVPMSNFQDFLSKAGTAKLAVVRAFKEQGKYDPRTDYYKKIRDAIVDCLGKGESISSLAKWLETVTEKKRGPYLSVLSGVGRVIGRRKTGWFSPPRENHVLGPMIVNVNPELGLVLKGEPHVIKLYLKDEPLKPSRAELILHLMNRSLASHDAGKVSVLDARAGRLFSATPKTTGLDALLLGEAVLFASIYRSS